MYVRLLLPMLMSVLMWSTQSGSLLSGLAEFPRTVVVEASFEIMESANPDAFLVGQSSERTPAPIDAGKALGSDQTAYGPVRAARGTGLRDIWPTVLVNLRFAARLDYGGRIGVVCRQGFACRSDDTT